MGNMSGSYGSHYTLKQTITTNSQNITNNTSNITVRLYLDFDGSSYYAYTNNPSNGSITINGETRNYSISNISFSSGIAKSILLAEWTENIEHNIDGTKILDVSAYWNTNVSRIGSGNCNIVQTLANIPRASSISCTTANVTEPAIITINSASSLFGHRVWVDFGDLIEVVISTNSSAGSFSWTIPENFYTQMPNSKSKTGVIYCRTYSGQTEIGLKTANFTVTTNEEKCKPKLNATVVDINEKTIDLSGNNKKLIKYKSTAKITINTSAQNGASINLKKVNNAIVKENSILIEDVETDTFIITAIDSRGYSNSITLKANMIDYIPLSIKATIKRTQPTTGEVDINFSGNYFNGSFGTFNNIISLNWYYKETNSENWILGGAIEPIIENNKYSSGKEAISLGKIFDYQKSYDFYLEVNDKISTLEPYYSITQGIPIFNWGEKFLNVNGNFMINKVSIFPIVLYDNAVGTNGSITFNENISEGDEIEILYCRRRTDNTSVYKSTKIPYKRNMEVAIDINYYSTDSNQQSMSKIVIVNDNGISVKGENTVSNTNANIVTSNTLYITRVVKYLKRGLIR